MVSSEWEALNMMCRTFLICPSLLEDLFDLLVHNTDELCHGKSNLSKAMAGALPRLTYVVSATTLFE